MACLVLMMLGMPDWLNTVCWLVILTTTAYSGVEYFVKNAAVFKS
jgi:hypothetical protein